METDSKNSVINECQVQKIYPNSIQKLAIHSCWIPAAQGMVTAADALTEREDLAAVCVVDEDLRPLGIVRKDEIFFRLGKPFGRELQKKKTVRTACEPGLIIPGDTNIFTAALAMASYHQNGEAYQDTYIILTGPQGEFTGLLPDRNLSGYMTEITNHDIETARLLQERLLNNADNPEIYRINVDAWSLPAKGVGGDFYYLKNIDAGQFFGTLCDVSGKGISAALVTAMAWGFLRAYDMRKGLRKLLLDLNASVISTFHLERYLTGFFFIYDKQKQMLSLVDMGHAHSVFIRNGKINNLEKSKVNLPIGIEEDIHPQICTLRIQSGDSLLIYTDGISEQDNPAGEEFGDERLHAITVSCVKRGEPLSKYLPQELEAFRGNSPQHDDMTFLLFQF